MQNCGVLEVSLNQCQLCLGLRQLPFQSRQFFTVIIDNISGQFVDAVQFVELVVKQQFSQDLVFAFCGVDLLSQFVGIFVDLAILRPLVYRLPAVVVDRLQPLPLSSLSLALLLDLVFVRPFRLGFLERLQLFGRALLIPRLGQYAPQRQKFLHFFRGDCTAADPVLDPGDVEHDLPLEGDALARRPVAHVFEEAAFDVLAVCCHYDPPE